MPKKIKPKSPRDTDSYIGNRLRAYRIERSMSQETLAKLLGVTFQQVQKYEKGTNRLSIGRVIQLADIFKVTVHDLIGRTDSALPVGERLNIGRFKLAGEFDGLPTEIVTAARHMLGVVKAALNGG